MEEPLVSWWRYARPFFQEHAPQIVSQIDDDAKRLTNLAVADASFCVCVLGQSAVGKSTLLNALVAGEDTLLPAGGIGPLTALATEVRYSAERYLHVTYRSRKTLSGYCLQLEKELKRQERGDYARPDNDASEFDDSDGRQTDEENDDSGVVTDRSKTFGELCCQITQVLTGDQFKRVPLADLVVGFRAVLGQKPGSLMAFSEADKDRIASAAMVLENSDPKKPTSYSQSLTRDAFDALVRRHVSGHLGPLVERIEIGYPSSYLDKNIVLVDLPGIGIANDRYRSVTSDYVRLRASAVVLVVDRAGPTEASVELIRDSGYWDRLLISSEDPENDPCHLLIVVTQLDNVARQQFAEQRQLPREQRRSLASLFKDLCKQVQTRIRAQADISFSALSAGVTKDQDVLDARSSAQETLMMRLGVFPVSAIEYRSFLADDEDERPFIRDSDSSGIPALVTHLESLSARREARLSEQKRLVAERLTRNANSTLAQLKASWSAASQAAVEAQRLREELARFLEPKQRELDNRKGAFREFLQTAGAARIGELVAKAQLSAQLEIAEYLNGLRYVNWATLRAAVVRGGAYVNRRGIRIDVAADIAQRFQEPLASIWGRTLLKDIHVRTRQYGTTLEAITSQICEWAEARRDTTALQEMLRAQERLMSDRVLQLGAVGSEAVDELKEAIMRDLMLTIEAPIRLQCEEFRRRGDAVGAGVQKKIHELFAQLASEAVGAAGTPTITLLEAQFVSVRTGIAKALEDWGDPIQQASDVILEREEQRRDRADAQRRHRMLGEIEDVMAELSAASAPENTKESA